MYQASCTSLFSLSKLSFWRFFNSFDTVLTSCEGVLWNSDKEIKGSACTLNLLREFGKQIFFITNNSMRTTDEAVEHAKMLGFIINKDEVISSSQLTAYYLKSLNLNDTVYIVGSRGLVDELDAAEIKHIGSGPDYPIGTIDEIYESAYISPNVRAVVVGLDEHFSFAKIIKAATYLENPKCEFVAVSAEQRRSGFFPKIVPATGAILAAIEACSGRKAKIIGKPSSFIGEYMTKQYCVNPRRTLLLGDRITTDVQLGNDCGFQTLIVTSGMTRFDEVLEKVRLRLQGAKGLQLPNLYTKSLEDFSKFLIAKEYKF